MNSVFDGYIQDVTSLIDGLTNCWHCGKLVKKSRAVKVVVNGNPDYLCDSCDKAFDYE